MSRILIVTTSVILAVPVSISALGDGAICQGEECNEDVEHIRTSLLQKALGGPAQHKRGTTPAEIQREETATKTGRLVGNTAADAGGVQSLYTFGSPGTGSPGLVRRDGSCFKGARAFTAKKDPIIGGLRSDPIPFLPNADWFWHPKMEALRLRVDDPSSDTVLPCSPETMRQPPWEYVQLPGVDLSKAELHLGVSYLPAIQASKQLGSTRDVLAAAFNISYEKHSPGQAQTEAAAAGYTVVGAAKFAGSITEGEQVSYLLQGQKDLDCIVTFQGTDSSQDAWTDAAAIAVPFCGLTEEGDTCCSGGEAIRCFGVCKPKGNRISFVHEGFRNQLRRMVSDPSFQANVRQKLPYCSSVSAFGHSLGGAMAELFTACVDQTMQEGDFGYADYGIMTWKKLAPQQLPERARFS